MQRFRSRVIDANARTGLPLSAFIAWAAVLLVGLSIAPGPLRAESMVVLEAPGDFEDIRATTFDKKGHAVGNSSFEITTDEAGVHRMTVTMAVEGGGRNVSEAILAPIAGAVTGSRNGDQALVSGGSTRTFRLVEEQSQATRADGVSLDFLVIDHAKGRVSCYPPDRDLTKGRHIDLPEDDRVVNVPMQLLFLPLVSGEVKAVRFQIALCRDGPVLHKMVAVRGPKSVRDDREIVEIRYGPDLGNAFAWLASRVLPKFSFWFNARDNSYVGHRMPLHRKGPEILLVRHGLTPLDIERD